MVTPGEPASGAAGTTTRLRIAAEARDLGGVLATFAPDVLLRSPITDRVAFRGHQEVGAVLAAVFATIDDIDYFADVGDERTRVLFYRARIGRQPLEEAMRLELDDEARIRELTVFYRPLPGLAALTAALGPRLAEAEHGRLRARIARIMLFPLALMTRLGDRLAPWFV